MIKTIKNFNDIFICENCLRELEDINNRRYFYPFISCNNCGLRYSIINSIDNNKLNSIFFDKYKPCEDCKKEKEDPNNRRYNYEFISCSACGPKIFYYINNKKEYFKNYDEAFEKIINSLSNGELILLKITNMFLLIADATNENAITKLRNLKKTFKPIPVLFKDIQQLEDYINKKINQKSMIEYLINSKSIVVIEVGDNVKLAKNLGYKKYLGVSLPFDTFLYIISNLYNSPIAFTSANLSGESIILNNQDETLKYFINNVNLAILHDLEIQNESDFNIYFNIDDLYIPVRKSIYNIGKKIETNYRFINALCVGPELENSICVSFNNNVFISSRMGFLRNDSVYQSFEKTIDKFLKMFNFKPDLIVADLHPYYLSTIFAQEFSKNNGIELKYIQHHKAHIYSLILDKQISGDLIGFSFDGTGYGEDGKIWGGEVFIGNIYDLKRIGHIKYFPIVAGDSAIENPIYIAVSYISKFLPDKLNIFNISDFQRELIYKMVQNNYNVYYTSSIGRVFDIAAVLAKIKEGEKINFSGQAAIELENIAYYSNSTEAYPFEILNFGNHFEIDPLPIFVEILKEKEKKSITYSDIARKFHNTIIDIVVSISLKLKKEYNINQVGLSGGVFQNKLLTLNIYNKLESKGLKVFIHEKVPPNDSGISLGQLASAIIK
ncbi:MAG: Sua5/YciO/YrdC/YwlC family protein [bacterium]|nr:Sua5/YciO/YrdC/YwlC family protein [bacterium]